MDQLPSYHVRSLQEESGQKPPHTRLRPNVIFTYQRIFLTLGLLCTILLASLLLLGNEPFAPTLEWWLAVKASFKRRSDHQLSIAVEPSWEGLKGGEHCLRYATRQYTAKLSDGPAGHDMMRVCKETPVEIHGQLLYTDFCQDLGFNRGVWGYWIVDFNEEDCETRWGEFVDLGCLNGIFPARRVEARLENLRRGDDWQFMCVTTPADIDGQYYSTPKECFNEGRWGIYGTWDLHDNSCVSQASDADQTPMGRESVTNESEDS